MKFTTLIQILCLFVASLPSAFSIDGNPMPFQEEQPDGTPTPDLYVVGNSETGHVIDLQGYTVIQNNHKWFVYAVIDEETGELKPSKYHVGSVNPSKIGLTKGVVSGTILQTAKADDEDRYLCSMKNRKLINTKGTLKNLVVLMRFSDHKDREVLSVSDFDILFNKEGGDTVLAPTGSIRDVYAQSSYGKFTLDSFVYKSWIDLPETEAYYAGNKRGHTLEMKEGMAHALEQIDSDPDFSFSDFDADDDGDIDAITFIHSGYAAEHGGKDCHGRRMNKRIWSHKGGLNKRRWTSQDGVKVNRYSLNPAFWGRCGTEITRIGVVAHEIGHFLGLPDLYDGGRGKGIGSYDLMSIAWGFDGTQKYPPMMSAWSKIKMGWMTPTILTEEGHYHLNASAIAPMAYMIDRGFPEKEYLLIENRQKISFDAKMKQGGLAIWHIDEAAERPNRYNTNEGFPGQDGWPGNGNHYSVALLQADGKYDFERNKNRGDGSDLFHKEGVNFLEHSSSPTEGPFPNTDSYQNGNIVRTGIRIDDISESDNTMSFHLSFKGPFEE